MERPRGPEGLPDPEKDSSPEPWRPGPDNAADPTVVAALGQTAISGAETAEAAERREEQALGDAALHGSATDLPDLAPPLDDVDSASDDPQTTGTDELQS